MRFSDLLRMFSVPVHFSLMSGLLFMLSPPQRAAGQDKLPLSVSSAGLPETSARLAERARAVLRGIFTAEENWIGIHAAEVLVEVGDGIWVDRALRARLSAWESSRFRIGAWRVLALTAPPFERGMWRERIERVFLDPQSPDRWQAIESLGKLHHRLSPEAAVAAEALAASSAGNDLIVLPLWALAVSGVPKARAQLLALLESEEPSMRRRSAYALGRVRPISAEIRAKIVRAAKVESVDTVAYPYLLSAAVKLAVASACSSPRRAELVKLTSRADAKVKFEALQALSPQSTIADLPWALSFLDHPHGDVRAGAALMVLRILNPTSS